MLVVVRVGNNDPRTTPLIVYRLTKLLGVAVKIGLFAVRRVAQVGVLGVAVCVRREGVDRGGIVEGDGAWPEGSMDDDRWRRGQGR